jgi:hypothetical protein
MVKQRGVLLRIPCETSEKMHKIFEVEKLLRELGVDFDTGTDFAYRDWCLDWSLKGAEIFPVEWKDD